LKHVFATIATAITYMALPNVPLSRPETAMIIFCSYMIYLYIAYIIEKVRREEDE
jgi:hypothetical protein